MFIAQPKAYGFDNYSLKLVYDYLLCRSRTKTGNEYSYLREIVPDVSQGSGTTFPNYLESPLTDDLKFEDDTICGKYAEKHVLK